MITPEQFKKRFPEFEKADLETVGFFIDDAKNQMSEKAWGKLYQQGLMNLTAHLLFTANLKGNVKGQVLSKKAADLQINYGAVGLPDDPFSTSSYGLEYVRLRKLVAKPFGVTR